MNDFEPYEIEGIAKIRREGPMAVLGYSDEVLRLAYRRYSQVMLSANWLEPTPERLADFYDWAFTCNLDLIRDEMRHESSSP